MNRRVSMRLPFSVKFFMSTVPEGKAQSPSAFTVICPPLGSAIQRVFTALSDQNGATGSYGMSPLAGCVGLVGSTQPVWVRRVGIVLGVVFDSTSLWSVPPLLSA